MNPYIMRK